MRYSKRSICYGAILIAAAGLAVWLNYEPPYLAELKRMEPVNDNLEPPLAVVGEALKAIGERDRNRLFKLMLSRDSTEFQRYTADLLAGADFLPAEPVRCARLVHCYRADNLSVFVRSHPRNRDYQFVLLKDAAGNYKIRSISLTRPD